MENNATRPARPSRLMLDLSDAVLRLERRVLTGLMTLLVLLILVNVGSRYSGQPIYWIDEASVFCVVWLCFVGASLMTRLRMDFAVSLLTDKLGPRNARLFKLLAGCAVLVFGLAMLVMCWIWLDPIGIARYGFDAKEYAANSFNILYTEKTQTLEWPTWLLQSILPIFSTTLSLHATANLIEDLGLQPRREHPGLDIGPAEAVN
jgi:TRAP-type C4-dicarboxylate transport system permease small subunit